jgi:hypothetical protein
VADFSKLSEEISELLEGVFDANIDEKEEEISDVSTDRREQILSMVSDTFYTREDNNFLPRDIVCKHCRSSDLSRYETRSGSLCPKCDRYSLVFNITMMSS